MEKQVSIKEMHRILEKVRLRAKLMERTLDEIEVSRVIALLSHLEVFYLNEQGTEGVVSELKIPD